MFKKAAAFLFAVGVAFGATAVTPSPQCLAQCNYDYNACKAAGGSYCGAIRSACIADCSLM